MTDRPDIAQRALAGDWRGSGRTTSHLLDAPQGAIFVWCADHPGYARDLARDLGRRDLRVVGLGALEHDLLRGLTGPVVTDHAVVSTPRIAAGLHTVAMLNARAQARAA